MISLENIQTKAKLLALNASINVVSSIINDVRIKLESMIEAQ